MNENIKEIERQKAQVVARIIKYLERKN